MDIASLLSTLLTLKNTVETIRKQGVMPYNNLTQYKKDAVVTSKGDLWIALQPVPYNKPPKASESYWCNISKGDNAVVSVTESDSEVVYTFSNGTKQVIAKTPAQTIIERYEGNDGSDGVGISNVSQNGDAVVITLTDGNSYTFTLPKASPIQPHTIQNISWENNAFVVALSDEQTFTIPVDLPKGDAATITIGEVITVDSSEQASVENVGDVHNAILNLRIPKGEDAIAISVIDIEQVSPEEIRVVLSDDTEYSFILPKGKDGKDADEEVIVNKIYDLLSDDVNSIESRLSLSVQLIREELQGLVDYTADDIEAKFSESLINHIQGLPRITTEDVRFIVQGIIRLSKQEQEEERQQGLSELRIFLSKYGG